VNGFSYKRLVVGFAAAVAAVAVGAPVATAYPVNPGNGDSYRAQWQALQHSNKAKLKKAKLAKRAHAKRR
jgi:hypothetical protein